MAPEDQDALRDLLCAMLKHCERFGGDIPGLPENANFFVDNLLLPAIAAGSDAVFLARANGQPIGAVFWICSPVQHAGAPKRGAAFGTYVASPFQRQGIGAALRHESLNCLRGQGVTRLDVQVHCSNDPGILSLTRLGFKPISTNYRIELSP
jgi:GNAT superfamily N-acetyltransferase